MNIFNILFGSASEDPEATKEPLPGKYTIRSLRLDEEDYYCERYEVYDIINAEVVYIGCPVYCGEYHGELVAVKRDCVYRLLRGAITHRWDSIGIGSTQVRLLSKEDFYENHINDEYPRAMENFAMYDCEQCVSKLLGKP